MSDQAVGTESAGLSELASAHTEQLDATLQELHAKSALSQQLLQEVQSVACVPAANALDLACRSHDMR